MKGYILSKILLGGQWAEKFEDCCCTAQLKQTNNNKNTTIKDEPCKGLSLNAFWKADVAFIISYWSCFALLSWKSGLRGIHPLSWQLGREDVKLLNKNDLIPAPLFHISELRTAQHGPEYKISNIIFPTSSYSLNRSIFKMGKIKTLQIYVPWIGYKGEKCNCNRIRFLFNWPCSHINYSKFIIYKQNAFVQ